MKRNFLANHNSQKLLEIGFRRIIGLCTWKIRPLPDFILIGAQRAGTTSLFNYLCQHPNIRPSIPKEVQYFSNYYHKGINWYRSHFPISWSKEKRSGSKRESFFTGEATPYYLIHPHAPQRVRKTIPDTLIIILLRNPVDRAYSHYYHEVRMGVENLTFGEAIDKEEERLDREMEKMIQNENYLSFNYQHYSYLSRGIYVNQIEKWKKHFQSQRFIILSSESFFETPAKTLRRITDVLEIPSWDLFDRKNYHNSSYPRMSSLMRDRLSQYFEPHNQKLYKLLNVDLGWED